MGIPGQTTSRPPPAIFKVDVSCGASSPSFLVPFAFLTAVISNLARCRRFPLSLSMFGHYYAVARACIGKPLSWPRYDRGFNTNYVSVRLFCGFARYRSYRIALLYSARIPSLFTSPILPTYPTVSSLLYPYDWINTISNIIIPIRRRIIPKFKSLCVWTVIKLLTIWMRILKFIRRIKNYQKNIFLQWVTYYICLVYIRHCEYKYF